MDDGSVVNEIKQNVHMKMSLSYSYLPTPPHGQDMTQSSFLKRSLTGLNSEFSFSKTSCLIQSVLLFTNSWRENWIHTFPKSISAM